MQYSSVWIYQILIMQSQVYVHLNYFHFLLIMNNAAMSNSVQVLVHACFYWSRDAGSSAHNSIIEFEELSGTSL
jgi:hypothetical protein